MSASLWLPAVALLIRSFVILLLLQTSLFAQHFSPSTESILDAGMTFLLHQEYDSAITTVRTLTQVDSTHTIGLFYQAVIEYTRLTDHEDYAADTVVHALVRHVEQVVTPQLQKRGNALDYYMAGTLRGYRGLLEIKKGAWLRGLKIGLKSMDLLEHAVALDTTLEDAYWSLGMYEYYSGKMGAKFSWLPFVEGNSAQGLTLIHRTIAHGRYAQEAAILALVWLLYEAKDYQQALSRVHTLRERYPANRMFMWPEGDILFKMRETDEALRRYQHLLKELEVHEPQNKYHQALCRWKIVQLYIQQNKVSAARKELKILFALPMSVRHKERFSPFKKKAEEARTALRDMCE